MTSKERLDDFIYEVLNTSDDEVDIKECHSYKSLLRDLEIAEIFKKYLVMTGTKLEDYVVINNVKMLLDKELWQTKEDLQIEKVVNYLMKPKKKYLKVKKENLRGIKEFQCPANKKKN